MIIRTIKKKKGLYQLFFLDREESLIVTEDLYYILNLKEGMDLEHLQDFHEKLEEDRKKQCFQIAVRRLDYSALSELELCKKLQNVGFEKNEIESTIHRLKELKFIDDGLLSEELIRSFTRQNLSKKQIEYKLRKKGIQEQVWKDALELEISEEKELQKAYELCLKKLKSCRNKTKEEIFKKLLYSLSYKGFSYSISHKAISKLFEEENIFE